MDTIWCEENENDRLRKKKLPFNKSERMYNYNRTGCPFYTNEAIEKTGEAIANVVSELISKIKQRDAVDLLQEIKNQIGEMQTYKLFSDDNEKYINRDEVLTLLDKKIKECSE
jgi:hypothetical protein